MSGVLPIASTTDIFTDVGEVFGRVSKAPAS
jgi:hypothetical protein